MEPGWPLLRASGVVHLSRRKASRHLGPPDLIGDGFLGCVVRAGSRDLVAGAAVSARIGHARAPPALSLSGRRFLRSPAALPAGVHDLDPARLLRSAAGHCDAANPFGVLG